MKDKCYFSWSYLPPHGKSCNMGKDRVDLEYTINRQCLWDRTPLQRVYCHCAEFCPACASLCCAQLAPNRLGAFLVKCHSSFPCCEIQEAGLQHYPVPALTRGSQFAGITGSGLSSTAGMSPEHSLHFVEQTLIKKGEGCFPPPLLLLFLVFALGGIFLKTSLGFTPSHIFPTSPSSKNIRGVL